MTTITAETVLTDERAELLETLAKHRYLFRFTAEGLTEEQARQRTTVSELTIGGLIKHVAAAERGWARFIRGGAGEMDSYQADFFDSFSLRPDETLESVLADYADAALETDTLIATVPDLSMSHPLPVAPWFEEGKSWSVRRVAVHLIAEIAQHAGHADIIRESIDGQKSMG
ncbi:DinB family protein [Tenggerimyces flavus]|uniref:DinB family protein n=1 Tax=Tenggerimyces flavus TaxID=1708749 RepID=A0ABV7Y6X1_9ACTN|nr:DinB family protein [Tenggerimyces flavus]MBM7785464.1 hypothetical protein [Tenggerimyces flavus]